MKDIYPTKSHLYISWEMYYGLIESLAGIVAQSDWQIDSILCIARGGLRMGDTLSRLFKVPLAILAVSSYDKQLGMQQGDVHIAKHITVNADTLQGNVLLLDDLVDSGNTLMAVREFLSRTYSDTLQIKVGVLWWKACSKIKPDFYIKYLPDNPWIHQPFEIYDRMCIQDLIKN